MGIKVERLQALLAKYDIDAFIYSFKESTHTVDEAAALVKCNITQIVKSLIIVLLDEAKNQHPILALVPGDRKVRQTLIRKILASNNHFKFTIKDSRLASPEEVLQYTGYQVGGVPPLIEGLSVIIDEPILNESTIYGGGGTAKSLLELQVEDLKKIYDPIIGSISKSI